MPVDGLGDPLLLGHTHTSGRSEYALAKHGSSGSKHGDRRRRWGARRMIDGEILTPFSNSFSICSKQGHGLWSASSERFSTCLSEELEEHAVSLGR
jgi:hypothetical protein